MSLIIMSGKNLPWGKGEEREREELSGEDAKEEGGGEGGSSELHQQLPAVR